MMTFILGFILGMLDDGAYMYSATSATKGEVFKAVVFYGVFFCATMGAIKFMVDQNYLAVLGVGLGGATGVALVAWKNKQ